MGTESVFASILFGKILRNIAKQKFYEEFVSHCNSDLKTNLMEVIQKLLSDTVKIKNSLGLDTNELLSTLIIAIVDTQNVKAELLAIGDGLVCKDGKLIEYEQDNIPDYLGYHLSEDFESWYHSLGQKLSIDHFNDLSISTDDIFTFKNLTDKSRQRSEREIINHLLIDQTGVEHDNFLVRKVR